MSNAEPGADAPRPFPPFAEVLTRRMRARRVSQAALGRAVGRDRSVINHWQHGYVGRSPYRPNVIRAAAALDLCRAQADELLRSCGLERLSAPALDEASDDVPREILARWDVTAPNDLPAAPTSFVGRGDELIQVAVRLADRDARLLTLTGPGGVGKTRLALRVATELLDCFSDGVYGVDLTPLTQARQMLPAIMRAVGLREMGATPPLERLRAYLRERRLLLALDNCEHLLGIAGDIAALLSAAPGLAVLATSRERLQLSSEHVHRVEPLPTPPHDGPFEALRNGSAAELFETRAMQHRLRPAFTPSELRLAAELCTWLEGLPLSVELAAGRLDELTLAELRAQLHARLDLSTDVHDLPSRQRSMRATIQWSVDLLSPADQVLFSGLAVFAGSWDLEAAEHTLRTAREDVEGGLARLDQASLIYRSGASDTARWRMLETIREYAYELFSARPDADELLRRHAAYCVTLVEVAPPYVLYPIDERWYERVDADYDDMRAALVWAETHALDLFARLVAALWPYWHERLRAQEGQAWIERALRLPEARELATAQLLTGAAHLGSTIGDYQSSAERGRRALELARRHDDHHGEALVLQRLALIEYTVGSPDAALALAAEALHAWERSETPAGVALARGDLGFMHVTSGDFEAAAEHLSAALEIYHAIDAPRGVLRSMTDQGLGAVLQGRLDQAIPLLTAAVELGQTLPGNFILPATHFYLGLAYLFAGNLAAGLQHEVRSLLLRRDSGDLVGLSYNLLAFAAIAHRVDDALLAAQLCGAVAGIMQRTQITFNPMAREIYDDETASVRASIGAAAFEEQFELGFATETERLVTAALSMAERTLAHLPASAD